MNTDDVRKRMDSCLNCAIPIKGIADGQTNSESSIKAETIKIKTDNRIKEELHDRNVENVDFVALFTHELKLKTEELDLGCDCNEKPLNSQGDKMCENGTKIVQSNCVQSKDLAGPVSNSQSVGFNKYTNKMLTQCEMVDAEAGNAIRCPGELVLKTEEIDLGCDCIEHLENWCSRVDFATYCAEEFKLKEKEVQLRYEEHSPDMNLDSFEDKKYQIMDKNIECSQNSVVFEEHEYPDVGILNQTISSEQTQTLEVITEERSTDNICSINSGNFVSGACDLKTEELDLGCDDFQHLVKLTSHTDEHKCKSCEKKFAKVYYLKCHMKVHTSEKPHNCSICDKKYSRAGYLNQHMQTHTGEKSHKCNICEKKFARKEHLKQHYSTHTGEKHYKCTICDQKFSWIGNLNRHMVKHTGERLHKCTVCNKTFSHLAILNIHISTHTNEKPHKCTFCEKKFAVKKYLNAHILTHTGEKIHKCIYCEKKFAKKYFLNNHILTHNGEKPHMCNICKKKFTLKGNLNQHMSRHYKKA